MKRHVAIVAVCALLSIAAFAVLVTADRQLGLPLPYTIPWSFTTVSIVAPALFAIANAIRLRRPVVVKPTPVRSRAARGASDVLPPANRAEGVVLLDFSNARKRQEQAA
jgi:hypothetical protein